MQVLDNKNIAWSISTTIRGRAIKEPLINGQLSTFNTCVSW